MLIEESKTIAESENILPLINVVFLLLIFFILSGVYTKAEFFVVSPPESISDLQTEAEPTQILLNKRGELASGDQAITLEQFQQIIYEAKVENSNALIQLKADQDVKMQEVFEIMEIIKNAEYENFQLLTFKK